MPEDTGIIAHDANDFEIGDIELSGKVQSDSRDACARQVHALQGRDLLVAVVLSCLYGSLMFCRMFFSVCADAIRRDPQFQLATTDITFLVVVSALGFGLGKVSSGVLLDKFDAKAGLYLSMIATSVCALAFASSSNYNQMMLIGILNSLPQAAGYPALAKLAYEYYDPRMYGRVFSLISIGSRVGSLSSSLVLGAAIGTFGWRGAIRVAPMITMAVLGSSLLVLRRTKPISVIEHNGERSKLEMLPAGGNKQDVGDSLSKKFRRVLTNKQWWVVNFASSFLLVSKGFEAYAAVYLGDVLKLSSSASGMIVATIPGGIVASLVFGSMFLEQLPLRRKAVWTVALCVLNFASLCMLTIFTWAVELRGSNDVADALLLALGAGSGVAPAGVAAMVGIMLFLMGLGAGYPFYIPQSIFSLELGGKDTAMVVGCGELLQALVGAVFALMGGQMAETMGWRYVLFVLACGAAAAVFFMCLFFAGHLQIGETAKSA